MQEQIAIIRTKNEKQKKKSGNNSKNNINNNKSNKWRHNVVLFTVQQIDSAEPELRFCRNLNLVCCVLVMVRISDNSQGYK